MARPAMSRTPHKISALDALYGLVPVRPAKCSPPRAQTAAQTQTGRIEVEGRGVSGGGSVKTGTVVGVLESSTSGGVNYPFDLNVFDSPRRQSPRRRQGSPSAQTETSALAGTSLLDNFKWDDALMSLDETDLADLFTESGSSQSMDSRSNEASRTTSQPVQPIRVEPVSLADVRLSSTLAVSSVCQAGTNSDQHAGTSANAGKSGTSEFSPEKFLRNFLPSVAADKKSGRVYESEAIDDDITITSTQSSTSKASAQTTAVDSEELSTSTSTLGRKRGRAAGSAGSEKISVLRRGKSQQSITTFLSNTADVGASPQTASLETMVKQLPTPDLESALQTLETRIHDNRAELLGELWLNAHKPTSASELCLHKRKVKEVSDWIEANVRKLCGRVGSDTVLTQPDPRNAQKLLFLSGPPGCGKSILTEVLCENELRLPILTWNEAYELEYTREVGAWNSEVPFESRLSNFLNFITTASKYPTLALTTLSNDTLAASPSPTDRSSNSKLAPNHVIVIDDVPYGPDQLDQRLFVSQSLLRALDSTRHVILFLLTNEYEKGIELGQLFTQELVNDHRVAHISMWPVAPSLLKKGLQRVLERELKRVGSHERMIKFYQTLLTEYTQRWSATLDSSEGKHTSVKHVKRSDSFKSSDMVASPSGSGSTRASWVEEVAEKASIVEEELCCVHNYEAALHSMLRALRGLSATGQASPHAPASHLRLAMQLEDCRGDLRSLLSGLQMSMIRQWAVEAPNDLATGGGFDQEAATECIKDEYFSMFHAVGTVLHCKLGGGIYGYVAELCGVNPQDHMDRPEIMVHMRTGNTDASEATSDVIRRHSMDVEDVLLRSGMDFDNFLGTLQQNYVTYFHLGQRVTPTPQSQQHSAQVQASQSDLDALALAADAFSDAAALSDLAEELNMRAHSVGGTPSMFGVAIAARGYTAARAVQMIRHPSVEVCSVPTSLVPATSRSKKDRGEKDPSQDEPDTDPLVVPGWPTVASRYHAKGLYSSHGSMARKVAKLQQLVASAIQTLFIGPRSPLGVSSVTSTELHMEVLPWLARMIQQKKSGYALNKVQTPTIQLTSAHRDLLHYLCNTYSVLPHSSSLFAQAFLQDPASVRQKQMQQGLPFTSAMSRYNDAQSATPSLLALAGGNVQGVARLLEELIENHEREWSKLAVANQQSEVATSLQYQNRDFGRETMMRNQASRGATSKVQEQSIDEDDIDEIED